MANQLVDDEHDDSGEKEKRKKREQRKGSDVSEDSILRDTKTNYRALLLRNRPILRISTRRERRA